ncbi:unnamed protein product [Angiostrongylus costaricensis]|uniref:Uncharacterized protein n=1 Tax=Angiostrongylus costaricensis TaxID=334426 RepID=A0A0R3PF91_ANGCS|nr:unnamed protein product [Angiostrongylus costaricensis]
MFMKNGLATHALFMINESIISERYGCACLGQEMNLAYDLPPEVSTKETSGLTNLQEHQGCSEENKGHGTH